MSDPSSPGGEAASPPEAIPASHAWTLLNTRSGKATVVSFAAGAFLIILASAALACIPWRGDVTVTPVDSNGDSLVGVDGREATTVYGGEGSELTGTMIWCGDDSSVSEPYNSAKAYNGDFLEIAVDADSSCADANNLDAGDYWFAWVDVGFSKDTADDEWEDTHRDGDCMDEKNADYWWEDQDGNYSPTINLASDTDSGTATVELSGYDFAVSDADDKAGGLCVNKIDDGSLDHEDQGNMVPVSIKG